VAGPDRPELDGFPRPSGISEADLIRGYSGLPSGRRRPWPRPDSTAETVRRDLAAAADADDASDADARDDVAAEARP